MVFFVLCASLLVLAVPSLAADATATAITQPAEVSSTTDQLVPLTDEEMATTTGEDGTVWIRCVGYKEGWKNAAYAYAGTVVIKRIAGSGWANSAGFHWGGNNEIHYWRWITPNQAMKNLGLGSPGLIIDRSTWKW